MGKINMSRVLLGGLVAGIIIDVFEGVLNGLVLAKQWSDYMATLGKAGAFSVNQLVWFNVIGLAYGIMAVRLYAAIRPRFGAGPATAARAAVAVWGLGYLLPSLTYLVAGLAPARLTLIALAVELVEMIVATMAGAALYKETEVAETPERRARPVEQHG